MNTPKPDQETLRSGASQVRGVGYQPKTGQRCHCRPGIWRDNCPDCEGTGRRIDFRAIRARATGETLK